MEDKIVEKFNNNIIFITMVSIYNKISILKNKFKLQKNNNLIIILDSPDLFDNSNNKELSGIECCNFLKEFILKMEKNISKENLLRMYNNISTLELEEQDKFLFLHGAGGSYLVRQNKMYVYSDEFFLRLKDKFSDMMSTTSLVSIYSHELLHMSSSYRSLGICCCGFHHYYASFNKYLVFSIGNSINEGVTELLNEKIFEFSNISGRYYFFKEVARIITDLIGEDIMIKLYFSNDLKGLIDNLSLYVSRNETINFIVNLDKMIEDIDISVVSEVFNYLICLFYNKIINDLDFHKITNEEKELMCNEFKIKIENMVNILNDVLEKINNGNNYDRISVNIEEVLKIKSICSDKVRKKEL